MSKMKTEQTQQEIIPLQTDAEYEDCSYGYK